MGKTGCTLEGDLDMSKFSEPLPWIGLYAAAASAACVIAMALDALHAFRYRKFWFPCKFFSINATTLTVLAVATKLTVDLDTSMPRQQDQLAKLSSAVFVCTVMANFMPSLGAMDNNNEILINLVALGILVVTVIVNICIQLHTGEIYVFWKEYVVVMALMLVLFILIVSSSLTIPATKCYFDMKYKKKHKATKEQCNYQMGRCISQNVCSKLKEDLNKYWMMAHTCNPQFVMGRLATCTASGAVCLLSTAALAEAMLRSYLLPQRFKFCLGESEYGWSTTLILVIQTIGVGIGTLGPASRWFIAINFTCPMKAKKAFKVDFTMEDYWVYKLNQWRDHPFFFRIYGRQSRNLAESTKIKLFDCCIHFQKGIVFLSKIIRLVSVYCVVQFLISSLKMVKWSLRCKSSASSESPSQKMQGLSQYVLHLEGEKELIDMIMERNCDPINYWIKIGEKNQPTKLVNLLEKLLKPGQEFLGVKAFDSNLVSSLDSREPPNCWALPVVTLTSIAVAIPNINRDLVNELIHCVHEAHIYIRFIEKNLDVKDEYLNIRKAAAIVWVGVDLQHKWLDVDLRKMAMNNNASPKQVLEELSNIAKQRFFQSRKEDANFSLWESPAHWPANTLAANSMYRITQTFLLASETIIGAERMFDKLSAMITDIVGACLTNLQHVISEQCHHSSIEQREEKIRRAILLLGRTHRILDILEKQRIPSTAPEHRWFIDTWRMSTDQNTLQPPSNTTTTGNDDPGSASTSPDVYLTVD